jgi:hypothetical protein
MSLAFVLGLSAALHLYIGARIGVVHADGLGSPPREAAGCGHAGLDRPAVHGPVLGLLVFTLARDVILLLTSLVNLVVSSTLALESLRRFTAAAVPLPSGGWATSTRGARPAW